MNPYRLKDGKDDINLSKEMSQLNKSVNRNEPFLVTWNKNDKLRLSWAKFSTTGTGLEYFFGSSAQCKIYVIQLT